MLIIREQTGKPLTIIIRDPIAEYLKMETGQLNINSPQLRSLKLIIWKKPKTN